VNNCISGWKRGDGLGPKNDGVVNPVIPDGRYDGKKKCGLGHLAPMPPKVETKKEKNNDLQLPRLVYHIIFSNRI